MKEQSLNDHTYQLLKRDIMTLKITPGEAISAQKIAERYGVSRTPAREAIVKLDREGLVEIYPQSRTLVSKIDTVRASQEWFVRFSLETDMIPQFIEQVSDEVIRQMEDCLYEQTRLHFPNDAPEHLRLDKIFHGFIYDTAGESLARTIIEEQMSNYDRIRYLSDCINEGVWQQTIMEHRRLIDAAASRDSEKLQTVLRGHIRRIQVEENSIYRKHPEYFQKADRLENS